MIRFEEGSFKDPSGRVFYRDGDVFRTLSPSGLEEYRAAEAQGVIAELTAKGLIPRTELLEAGAAGLDAGHATGVSEWVLRQERIAQVTYPYEWSFEMLRSAALCTLEILEVCIPKGFILKDATAFNVLFRGTRPVWVDVPSIEPLEDGAPWAGYGQFCRSFLFPLLIEAHKGFHFQPLLRGFLGEIPVGQARAFFGLHDVFKAGVLKDVILQAMLERSFASRSQDLGEIRRARLPREMLLMNVARLKKLVGGLRPPRGKTTWGDYASANNNYTDADLEAKKRFVDRAIGGAKPDVAVDLGCNTGIFTEIASRHAGAVLSVDIDPEAIDGLYLGVRGGSVAAKVSPLLGDLTNPTPAMGWNLSERRGWKDRIRGDFFLALALIHHLRITGNVPLAKVLDHLYGVGPEGVIEWVDKEDSMIKRMLALRKDVYADYTWENFERLLRQRGEVVSVEVTHGGRRRLCHVRRRAH